jgi:hypothetical protein
VEQKRVRQQWEEEENEANSESKTAESEKDG